MSAERSKALVVEDQAPVRAWMVETLREAFADILVDQARDIRTARDLLSGSSQYRIALVDIGLPDGSGVDLIRYMANAHPSTLIVVTTIYDDDEHLFPALAAGANGYLLKDQTTDRFLRHLKRLEEGVPALSPSVARRMLQFFRQHPVTQVPEEEVSVSLSRRETEILSYIGRGLRVGEVASTLGLSEHTVTTHVKSIYRKLNISSRAEAALEAARRGLT